MNYLLLDYFYALLVPIIVTLYLNCEGLVVTMYLIACNSKQHEEELTIDLLIDLFIVLCLG